LRGRIEAYEALGRESLLTVTTGNDARFIVQVEGHRDVKIDDELEFGLRRGKLHFFNSDGWAIGRV
jgi:ABC-type sugar transport system ATPase subunit